MKAADAAEAEFDGDIVLPAVSTSGFAFQAILDDLVRTVGDDELAASIASAAERSHAQTRGPDTPSHLSADGLSGPLVSAEDALESSPGGAGGGADGMRGPDTPSHLSADGLSGPFVGSAAEDSAGQPTAAAVGASGARPPALLRGRGDLTLVIGLGADALAAARALAEAIGDAEVRPGGCSRAPAARVDDRRGALRARADGVRRERAVVVAFGMTRGADEVAELAEALAGIAPDQVWAAVDASRKAEDTAAWVRAVDAVLAVDALVVTGSQVTATPGSVRELGIPIGWLDGAMVSAGPVGTAPVGIG